MPISTVGSECGFTLLELLVVLAIGAGILALVVPSLSGLDDTLVLRGAVRELSATMRQARVDAVLQQQSKVVLVDLETRQAILEGRRQTVTLPEAPVELGLYAARSEVRDEQRAGYRFYPDGSASGGYLTLRGEREGYRLNLDWLTGRIHIVELEDIP